MVVVFDTHEQSDLFVYTQNTSLALALTCVVVGVELEPSSLDVPSIQCHFYPSSLRYSSVAHFKGVDLL